MKSYKFREENITITAADGRKLSARWWSGENASQRSVVFLSGIATPQGYLRWLATYLCEKGWGVLTFDYRGIGTSRDKQFDSNVTIDEWINLDIPAAVSEVKRRTRTQFLIVIAHSLGGQLLGQSPILKDIDSAFLISSQRGIPKLFKGIARLKIHYAYTVFPILIRIFEDLPISKWTFPQYCPSKVLLQWIRWGSTGVFTDKEGINVESRFVDYKKPLITVTIADDQNYASADSVEALASLYSRADVRKKRIMPQDYGLNTIGHFGLFHRRTPKSLWSQMEKWLRQLYVESDLVKSQST